MKHLYLNLKRFDVPVEYGGVNRIAPLKDWGSYIVAHTQEGLKHYDPSQVEFVQYFPEAHILGAVGARCEGSLVQVGCQGVYRMNTAVGGNFGAFTTNRPASAARAMGCASTIIGHCEERNDKAGILAEAGVTDTAAVNRLLNQEIRLAVEQGLTVLYCIGEKSEEQEHWQDVLGEQLRVGLDGVYGGGLKVDNAEMLASIDEIDGGLIALTRFQGEIGFYPDEYLEIIKTYLGN